MATLAEALALAVDHHAAGRTAEAEALYRRILDAVPGQADALHLLGVLLAQTGRSDEALVRLDAAVAASPAAVAIRTNRAKVLDALGRSAAAGRDWQAVLAAEPGNTEAAERLGRALREHADRAFDAGAFDAAATLYRRVLALAPSDLTALFDSAMAALNRGLPTEAARLAGSAGRIDPALLRAALVEAEGWRAAGRATLAARAYRRAVALQPADASLRMALALILHEMADARAEPAYRAVLSLEPADAAAWTNLSIARRTAHDPKGAVTTARRAAIVEPRDVGARVNLGAALLAAEDPRGAVAVSRAGLALDPATAELLLNLGSALDARHAAHDAARALRRALRLRPGDVGALAQLGRVGERIGPAADALRLIRRALATVPADAEGWAAAGRAALTLGDAHAADCAARRALRLVPDLPSARLLSGAVAEADGEEVAALAAYDRVIERTPGLATAFTRRALLILRRTGAAMPRRLPSGGRRRLTMTTLGQAGRFGNQLLQYATARLWAERQGLELETPDWIGRWLYGCDDPLPGPPLPALHEDDCDLLSILGGPTIGIGAGRDLVGYFCGDTTPLAPHRDRIRALFQPVGAAATHAAAAVSRLRERGCTVVAVHLRRGDFGGGRFWIAPEAWYLEWLDAVWPRLDRPVLCIATDAPALVQRFATYNPLQAGDLAPPVPGAEFFIDHSVLASADVVAVSNSSFSVTAAMLNPALQAAVRPDRAAGRLVPFDPWNGPVLLD